MKKNTLMALCLVLALLLILCGCSGEKEEAYRMIQVLEVSGTVSVDRQTMGTMDAYEGMRLESGDKITVGEDSWLKIKMDEDKYALVEPASVLRLEASGSSADSKTVLHLETGAVSNRLEKELSADSVYEVNTPNSTMAVRGTVFRVEIRWSEDGISVSDISVYDGKVASRLIYPDGTVDGEGRAVLIAAGTEAQVWGNDILSRYVTTDEKLEIDDLRLKTLEFLQEAREAGQELNIPSEELEELITVLERETGEVPAEETTAPAGETAAPTEETTVPTTVPAAPRPVAPAPEEDEEGEEPETVAPTTEAPTEGPTEAPTEGPTEAPTEGPTEAPTEGPTEAPTEGPTEAPTEAPTEEPTETTAPSTYTVTFQHNGVTFATQTVTHGETATAPKLQPTQSGRWMGIDTPITGNTTIVWTAAN